MKCHGLYLRPNIQEINLVYLRLCKLICNVFLSSITSCNGPHLIHSLSLSLSLSLSSEDRERYIRAKYCDKEFIGDLPSNDIPLSKVTHFYVIVPFENTFFSYRVYWKLLKEMMPFLVFDF